jgi:hypothetical protein
LLNPPLPESLLEQGLVLVPVLALVLAQPQVKLEQAWQPPPQLQPQQPQLLVHNPPQEQEVPTPSTSSGTTHSSTSSAPSCSRTPPSSNPSSNNSAPPPHNSSNSSTKTKLISYGCFVSQWPQEPRARVREQALVDYPPVLV